MSYVAEGLFRRDLEQAIGRALLPLEEPDERDEGFDDQLALLPAELAADVDALWTLVATFDVPELCGMRWGGFCTLPDQNGDDRDEVIDMFRGDDVGAERALSSLEICSPQGCPYVVVGPEGVGLLDEDPSGFALLDCTFAEFLQVLLAAHVRGLAEGMAGARAVLAGRFDEGVAERLVRRAWLS